MVSALALTPAQALPTGWTYQATYNNQPSCTAAGGASGVQWQCVPSDVLPGGYDLYLLR